LNESPQNPIERSGIGVRLILENSTACQKSTILLCPPLAGLLAPCVGVGGFVAVSLVMHCLPVLWVGGVFAGVLFFVVLAAGLFVFLVGVGGCWFSTESLILAQDERWRCA
jgi:hypothetical protein